MPLALDAVVDSTKRRLDKSQQLGSRSHQWRQIHFERVDSDPPSHVVVVFRYRGQRFGWRYLVEDDGGAVDAVTAATDIIDANLEEMVDTGQLEHAPPPGRDGITWIC